MYRKAKEFLAKPVKPINSFMDTDKWIKKFSMIFSMYKVITFSDAQLPKAINPDGEKLLMNVKFWVLYTLLNHKKHPELREHLLMLFEPNEESMDVIRKELGKIYDLPGKENDSILNESMNTPRPGDGVRKTPSRLPKAFGNSSSRHNTSNKRTPQSASTSMIMIMSSAKSNK